MFACQLRLKAYHRRLLFIFHYMHFQRTHSVLNHKSTELSQKCEQYYTFRIKKNEPFQIKQNLERNSK